MNRYDEDAFSQWLGGAGESALGYAENYGVPQTQTQAQGGTTQGDWTIEPGGTTRWRIIEAPNGDAVLIVQKTDLMGRWVPAGEMRLPGRTTTTAAGRSPAQEAADYAQAGYYNAMANRATAEAGQVGMPKNIEDYLIREMERRIAAGEITADQGLEELGQAYQKWVHPEIGVQRAGQIGNLLAQEQDYWKQMAPYVLPKTAEWAPGFEPTGPLERIATMFGGQYNAEQYKPSRLDIERPEWEGMRQAFWQSLGLS